MTPDYAGKSSTFTVPGFKNQPSVQHIILEVKDDGEPALYSYRRVTVMPQFN